MKNVLSGLAKVELDAPRFLDGHIIVPILDNPSTTQLPSIETTTTTKGRSS